MTRWIPVAWLQLKHQRLRFFAAIAGITLAVVLMLVQLGFEDGLISSAGLHLSHMSCDIALISPTYEFMLAPGHFPERRLYQCLAVDGVADVEPVYVAQAPWKDTGKRTQRSVFILGFPPRTGYFDQLGIDSRLSILREGAQALLDTRGRPEFGPVAAEAAQGKRISVEIAGRRVDVVGTFSLGTSFGVNGTVVMSDRTFLRTLPFRRLDLVDFGLIKLKPGYDAEQVRARIAAALPNNDVRVLTHKGLIELERTFWETYTAIGFVFQIGVLMGMFVGCIIVYQILYTDVTDHLSEYATLKAIGYSNRYLFGIVIQEGLILSLAAYVPGVALSAVVYRIASAATMVELHLPLSRIVVVYVLTAIMCIVSGALAGIRVYRADPADVF